MNLKNPTLRDILTGLNKKTVTSKEIFSYYNNRISDIDSSIGAIITRVPTPHIKKDSIPIGHKDIFSTKGIKTTAASHILKDYVPPYSATSVERLESAGFTTIAKFNCDAFAHGATGENSEMFDTKNPYDLTRVPGGSSSGSAAAVAAGLTPVATATDTGGSIRFPASYTNTVGIKPTYGRVSRNGVFSMTSSTDSIGHITKTVWDNAYILNITAGYDPLDATSSRTPVPDYLLNIENGIEGLILGVPKEYLTDIDPEIEHIFDQAVTIFKRLGAKIVEVSLPNTKYAINSYYIITPSEISSNLARLSGVRYGYDRSTFGDEAKRRIMVGTFCLSAGYYDQYYKKAQKARTLVIKDFTSVYSSVDALIAPVSAVMQPKLGDVTNDPIKNYMLDVLAVPASLAGVPALAIPAGFVGHLPVGIQIIGKHFDEELLYRIGHAFERETLYYKIPPTLGQQ